MSLIVSSQDLIVREGIDEELDLAEAGAEPGALGLSLAARVLLSLTSPVLVLNTPRDVVNTDIVHWIFDVGRCAAIL